MAHNHLKQEDLKLMLAAKVHHGARNVDPNVERYCWNRKQGGVHIINLGKTWEKLILAARIIVAIENPADVVVVSARTFGQRAVFKYAQYTGASYIGGRYTPGTFTNQSQKKFMEPRLLIVTDPLADHQPLKESSYVNIPTIAFCGTDASLSNVDVAIPANNKSKLSIALMYWLLAREVLKMRRDSKPLNVMVDLFMYREPEEVEKQVVEEKDRLTSPQDGAQEVDGGNQQPDTFDNQADLQTPDPNAKIDWGGDNQQNFQGNQTFNQSQGASWDSSQF